MKHIIGLVLLCTSIVAFTQATYKEGYFINNSDQKIKGLILDEDWYDNPDYITFKKSRGEKREIFPLEEVKSFAIGVTELFVRAEVEVDRSNQSKNNMSRDRNPEFVTETHLLTMLIDGNPSLFVYREKGKERFFYQVDTGNIRQLVYKSYKNSKGVEKKNYQFRQQLTNDVLCTSEDLKKVEKLTYYKKSLFGYFIEQNKCNGSSYTTYWEDANRRFVHLSVRPGLNINRIQYNRNPDAFFPTIDFGWNASFRFGIELEIIVPLPNNRLAVIFEPNFQSYSKTGEDRGVLYEAEYTSIEIPIGVRFYVIKTPTGGAFVNALFSLDIAMNSSIMAGQIYQKITDFSAARDNFSLGLGYKLQKWNAEFRYYFTNNLIKDYDGPVADYDKLSFIVGYQLL